MSDETLSPDAAAEMPPEASVEAATPAAPEQDPSVPDGSENAPAPAEPDAKGVEIARLQVQLDRAWAENERLGKALDLTQAQLSTEIATNARLTARVDQYQQAKALLKAWFSEA